MPKLSFKEKCEQDPEFREKNRQAVYKWRKKNAVKARGMAREFYKKNRKKINRRRRVLNMRKNGLSNDMSEV